MKFVRAFIKFLCTSAIVVIGFYAVIGACISAFIIAGLLTPGNAMFFDAMTPSLASSTMFSVFGFALVAVIGFIRSKLSSGSGAAA